MHNTSESSKPRRAMRFDLWLSEKRESRARKKGKLATVVPFMGYGSTSWIRVLGRVALLSSDGTGAPHLDGRFQDGRVRGWRSFMIVHDSHALIDVFLGNTKIGQVKADSGGVIDSKLETNLPVGRHTLTLISEDGVKSQAPLLIVDPQSQFGIISDIDDTILNTVLPKPFVAAWNSFVIAEHARLAVPGMPVLLDHLVTTHPGSAVVYLSTGAWNVAPALSRFLKRHMYPPGPLLLTDWGPTKDRLFRSGADHKRTELRRLAKEFPHTKWLLIGDDGQHDEQLYHEFVSEFPQHVSAVAIRQLSPGEAVLAGGRSGATKHREVAGVPWIYGPDGSSLRKKLASIGIFMK
ncbi:App1 family protein [Canibacter oris]|uniref:Phosphatidate phosphatase APP1 n=1 Tax=Canibacter oris TaxID=1365628 RepID=A0A840DET6_9MICO|nr:phosphatase domain-containing protein [Canibacter oris]MBB4071941.1 phosphatidate phosphatase APP1 [Canibacter oris]